MTLQPHLRITPPVITCLQLLTDGNWHHRSEMVNAAAATHRTNQNRPTWTQSFNALGMFTRITAAPDLETEFTYRHAPDDDNPILPKKSDPDRVQSLILGSKTVIVMMRGGLIDTYADYVRLSAAAVALLWHNPANGPYLPPGQPAAAATAARPQPENRTGAAARRSTNTRGAALTPTTASSGTDTAAPTVTSKPTTAPKTAPRTPRTAPATPKTATPKPRRTISDETQTLETAILTLLCGTRGWTDKNLIHETLSTLIRPQRALNVATSRRNSAAASRGTEPTPLSRTKTITLGRRELINRAIQRGITHNLWETHPTRPAVRATPTGRTHHRTNTP